MLRFDRGGAYAQVFEHCRKENVHWVTYRRAPLAVPSKLPVITAVTYAGKTRELCWSEETVQIKDYGDAQQLTLFERGQVALQILASDFGACPADLLSWLNPVAGRELPQVRAGELRDRQHLRLPRRDHRQHQARPQPGPRQNRRRCPRRPEGPGRRRA
jgi:hypothetical protein